MPKPLFEHTTCPRCAGTGRYSFNMMDGDRCYGCGGSGFKLTKRGRAAQNYLNELRSSPAGDLKVGDLVWFDMLSFKCCERIASIEPDKLNQGIINISAIRTKTGETIGMGVWPTTMIKRGFDGEQKLAQEKLALEYQATLCKTGLPRKAFTRKAA